MTDLFAGDHWHFGERWTVEAVEDQRVDVLVATARPLFVFTALVQASDGRREQSILAEARGMLDHLERVSDGWGEEIEHQMPRDEFARLLKSCEPIDGLFGGPAGLDEGIVLLAVIPPSQTDPAEAAATLFGHPYSQFSKGGIDDPSAWTDYWSRNLEAYTGLGRFFDLTGMAQAAAAEQYELALRAATGRRRRG